MTPQAFSGRARWQHAGAAVLALFVLTHSLPAIRVWAQPAAVTDSTNAGAGNADATGATAISTETASSATPSTETPSTDTPSTGAAPGTSAATEEAGERLIAPMPQDWTLVERTNTGDLRTLEYAPLPAMPKAEDERIVIESSRAPPVTDPREFLRMLARDAHRHCEPLRARELSHRDENGYATSVWLLDCPLGPGKGTPLQMVKAIRGDEWFYVISRTSSRADTRPENVANERTRIGDWSQHLRRVTACHLVRPDHPCPRAQTGTP